MASKMSKKFFFVSLCIFLSLILFSACSQQEELAPEIPTEPQVCIDGHCYTVELAITGEDTSKGLMHRESLDRDAGMLFIFPFENIYTFWMKNTLIPLDIIWINEKLEIVYLAKNVIPCKEDPCERFMPTRRAMYVLEINAGESIEKNFSVGQIVEFKNVLNETEDKLTD